jgi:hypothetical protein
MLDFRSASARGNTGNTHKLARSFTGQESAELKRGLDSEGRRGAARMFAGLDVSFEPAPVCVVDEVRQHTHPGWQQPGNSELSAP